MSNLRKYHVALSILGVKGHVGGDCVWGLNGAGEAGPGHLAWYLLTFSLLQTTGSFMCTIY